HRAEARARGRIKQFAEHIFLLCWVKTIQTDQAGFQNRSAEAQHGLILSRAVDMKRGALAGRFRRKVERGLRRKPVALIRGNYDVDLLGHRERRKAARQRGDQNAEKQAESGHEQSDPSRMIFVRSIIYGGHGPPRLNIRRLSPDRNTLRNQSRSDSTRRRDGRGLSRLPRTLGTPRYHRSSRK